MAKHRIGYSADEKEKDIDIEDYKEKWIIVSMKNDSIVGILKQVLKDRITLMPYQSINYHNEQKKYEIVRDGLPLLIERSDICILRQTDEENVSEFCEYSNRQIYIEEAKKESELNKILSQNKKVIIVPR